MEFLIIGLTIINLIILILVYKKTIGNNSKDIVQNYDFIKLEKKIEEIPLLIKLENQVVITEEMIKITKNLGENNNKIIEKFGELQTNLNKDLFKFNNDFKNDLNNNITELIKTVNNNLENINKKVENRLTDGFEKTTKTLNTITESLGENNNKIIEKFGKLQTDLSKDLFEFNNDFKTNLNENLDKNINNLIKNVSDNLENINKKVEDRLADGFEKTTKTFGSIIERLAKIDEAQKKIESLSENIVSLQDVLTDKKSRGIFGEIQLNQILVSTFGEGENKLYSTQYTLSNNYIADAVIFAPDPIGTIVIDSKFPLENYKLMIDVAISNEDRKIAKTNFKQNMKKHIDDISNKYIIQGETSDQAILFLPAEAIFAEVNAYHQDLIDYSQKKKVWIASPTTLMAVLSTLQVIVKNLQREKYAHIIQEELIKLSQEFNRYRTRWESLSKDLDKVSKDVKDINVTSDKIGKRFEMISNVTIEKIE